MSPAANQPRGRSRRRRHAAWDDGTPVRAALFSVERLEQHAQSLAAAQTTAPRPPHAPPLSRRLAANATAIAAVRTACARAVALGVDVAPAAAWLLDNHHSVAEQIREIGRDLPPGYYRQLPKLAEGVFAGYPRVFGIAWAFVAHTDSRFDPEALRRFVVAYQRVAPLAIGELWAVAITLRIVLVENLRRLSDGIARARALSDAADAAADRMLGPDAEPPERAVSELAGAPLPDAFASQLARRLRDCDPRETPARAWLDVRLAEQGADLDDVVRASQDRQGASNVTMRNVITSMRAISDADWAAWVEAVSLVDARLRDGLTYAAMDFATRNLYRTAVEDLARGSGLGEIAVADAAMTLAAAAADGADAARRRDPGFFLIGDGRAALERAISFRPAPARRLARAALRLGIGGYVAAVIVLTALVLSAGLAALGDVGPAAMAMLAATGVLPAMQAAVALTDRLASMAVGARALPGLALPDGPPPAMRTLVAVPTLLGDPADIAAQIEALEVLHLSNGGGEIGFAMVTDWPDAATETTPADAPALAAAERGIAALNARHGPGPSGPLFMLLHRRRIFAPLQGCWMGWERKRGKLHELNRMLRGARDTSFIVGRAPEGVAYVLTLDADTRLPRDAARRLIGKMAHPLNRPRVDPDLGRVVEGHGVMQPRVTPALPMAGEGSAFQRIFSSPGGMDAYATTTADVWQDLFGVGAFSGKGLYDVDAFEAAMAGRVPSDAVLSHDLFEGVFARAGFASDVEVIEDHPARYDVAARRAHRWARGDWQLAPWLFGGPRHVGGGVPRVGRVRMADTLRRSALPPLTLFALSVGWTQPPPVAAAWTGFVLAAMATPALMPIPFAALAPLNGATLRSRLVGLGGDLRDALARTALELAFLPDYAWRMGDAILRTAARLRSRRRLLEWVSAAEAQRAAQLGWRGFHRRMAGGLALGVAAPAAALAVSPGAWPVAAPFALLWLAAPTLAWRISRPMRDAPHAAATGRDVRALRLIARRTWRYFETFATPADGMLPPDNMQEDPREVIARRTSPTNIGLGLLSAVAARDFGWASSADTLARIEATLATMARMQRFRGHFLNWCDTRDLRVLDPPYVSTVDSGNLAGHLIAVARACDEAATTPVAPAMRAQGAADAAALAAEAPDDPFWATAAAAPEDGADLSARWRAAAATARRFAMKMDFAFLMDPERKLFSIGFSIADNARDAGCYDLLASEARLASLIAIAKGDAPTKHWFRLGRAATPVGAGAALMSWSGSMFEYLMPSLVMRAPAGALIETSNRRAVARQQAYGREMGLPWGVSESAYNARDIEFTYQYSNFGVPGLGLKRGLGDSAVVAPYATGLAAMVDPHGAAANFAALAALGGLGRYGFYEALDFTPARLPAGARVAVVKAHMAHHQGMTIVAIANTLLDGIMRRRFHEEPMIRSVELLLQERAPRAVSPAPASDAAADADPPPEEADGGRRIALPSGDPLATHLMSNGGYGVMITAAGGGWSRWRGNAVTRWREDATRDADGPAVHLRDVAGGATWRAGWRRDDLRPASYEALFDETGAAIVRADGRLTTMLEAMVSPEDDAEVRRVSLLNRSRRAREIELTSCLELALAPMASDAAHPAFSKLFVQTSLDEDGATLIATRRRRSPEEPEIWAAHLAVVEGAETAPGQWETDRARLIARDGVGPDPAGMAAPLSGALGTVLDPAFALRRRVRVPAGGVARVAFWTMAAESRAALDALIDRHRDPSAFGRAQTLAWTQSRLQLRHLGVTTAEAADFQRLAGHVVTASRALRPASAAILRGAGPQSGLWRFSISGDLPIVLLRIEDVEDMAQVAQLLRAHEYWRTKRLSVDLVILNERVASYAQDLQTAIETAVRSGRPRLAVGPAGPLGSVFALRADLAGPEACGLLRSVARVELAARRGPLRKQLERLVTRAPAPAAPRAAVAAPAALTAPPPLALEFFNGTGGFDRDGREYVVVLGPDGATPAPWINVIANPGFGFHVSATGAGATWSVNSRENQLTPWSNDPVADPAGEALYLRDEDSGALVSPTAAPLRDGGAYIARHGFGYSRFEHEAAGLAMALTLFVPVDAPVKVMRLTVRNLTAQPRRLSLTGYAEWVMGRSRAETAPFLTTGIDPETGAMLARNPWSRAFPGRVAFADLAGRQTAWTADRTAFLGPGGAMADPVALRPGARLDGATGAGLDPCAALQGPLTLAPGETAEAAFLIGEAASVEEARALVLAWRGADLDAAQAAVGAQWSAALGAVQVRTPDRAMDVMLNGWLLYQTLACRVWARAGFYQASGAYGFRDQVQDGMALTFARPDLTRAHLLRAAGRQFPEGDVQHWWLPHSGEGVRTRISDDRVWLAYAAATYVRATGDAALLDESVPFLEGPALRDDQHEALFLPETTGDGATVLEHCARGLDQCVALTGADGMPLIGGGDWNDGMNRVGIEGKGTSVWLGWLFIAAVDIFAPLAEAREPDRCARWRAHAGAVRDAIEAQGWDGAWYRRGAYDDGAPLGVAASDECRIDSIAQSWAVLSGAGEPSRAALAMQSVASRLIRPDPGLALLFDPPFDKTERDPGYIKGYPPGVRENGGQYSHAAMWAVMAYARLGDGDQAGALFALLNPINHARNGGDAARYRVEPYVVAADVYSVAPHAGRGGWSWYTGSAGWMQRAGVESILGVSRRGGTLRVAPCIPAAWPGFDVVLTLAGLRWSIAVENPDRAGRGVVSAWLDGRPVPCAGDAVELPFEAGDHTLRVVLGRSSG